ncbi:TadE/TadG family type IV pilus assembly protein [Nocardioides malaquae]|uniref:TadE/TadG family type IV pilus assembly protein n=1 Tax=Nocardioides malaquae TaxID=2773426 RepID=UPI0029D41C9E|nr:TadE/TadG family type IV pilus assembly protein [Nocardioides malaquae]
MLASRRRDEQGTAVVDFVLVMLVLVPLVLAIMQVSLVLYVRNTVALAASEGARHAAAWGASPQDGLERTRQQWTGAVSSRFVTDSRIEAVEFAGAPAYRVVVEVDVPALGLGGPGVGFEVSGSAVIEPDPSAAAP